MNLTISPDDILAARKRQRSLKHLWKNILKLFAILAFWGWAALSSDFLSENLPMPPVQESTAPLLDAVLIPVIIVVTIYLTILIHEIGHLVAGLINRFEFNYVVIGPFKLYKSKQGLKVNFSGLRFFQLGGLASVLSTETENLKWRYWWTVAGGPLATVFQFLFFVALIYLLQEHAVARSFSYFLLFSTLWPVALFLPSSIIPMGRSGLTNDGARLWFIWKDNKRAEWYTQGIVLHGTLNKEGTPEKLEFSLLERLHQLAENEIEKFVANNYIYDFHMAKGNTLQAGDTLNNCLLAIQAEPNMLISPLAFLEAAYFSSVVINDGATARRWLDLAQKDHKKKAVFVPLESLMRAEAAVLATEGQFEKAYVKAAETMKRLEAGMAEPIQMLETSYLEKIMATCAAHLDSLPSVNIARSGKQIVWSVSKSLLKFTLLFGSILVCAFCLIMFSIAQIRYDIAGFYYEMKGDDDRALQIYEEGMASLDEPSGQLLNSHGEVLVRQGMLPQALADFNASIEAEPERYDAYMNRGYIYLKMEFYGPAVADFDKSLELEPSKFDLVDIYFARAASLSGIAEYDLAVQDYDQILQLSDDPEEIELATHYRDLVLGYSNE